MASGTRGSRLRKRCLRAVQFSESLGALSFLFVGRDLHQGGCDVLGNRFQEALIAFVRNVPRVYSGDEKSGGSVWLASRTGMTSALVTGSGQARPCTSPRRLETSLTCKQRPLPTTWLTGQTASSSSRSIWLGPTLGPAVPASRTRPQVFPVEESEGHIVGIFRQRGHSAPENLFCISRFNGVRCQLANGALLSLSEESPWSRSL